MAAEEPDHDWEVGVASHSHIHFKSDTHTLARTHTRTHIRAHTRTHTHEYMYESSVSVESCVHVCVCDGECVCVCDRDDLRATHTHPPLSPVQLAKLLSCTTLDHATAVIMLENAGWNADKVRRLIDANPSASAANDDDVDDANDNMINNIRDQTAAAAAATTATTTTTTTTSTTTAAAVPVVPQISLPAAPNIRAPMAVRRSSRSLGSPLTLSVCSDHRGCRVWPSSRVRRRVPHCTCAS
jgi:hypothetical protein